MKDNNASLVAFLVTPAVPAVAFALSSPGLGGGLEAGASTLAGLSVLFYPFALVAVGLIALPLFLVFRTFGQVGLASSVAAGALVSGLVTVVLQLPPASPLTDWFRNVANALPFMCSVGALSGLVFWAVRKACMVGRSERAGA
jgi:hypothetical protein